MPALLLLLIVALAVVFWLPQMLAPQAPLQPPEASAPAVTPVATVPKDNSPAQAPGASPWSEAQQGRLRKEAQEVLAELLELQFTLEQQGARRWAADDYAAATAAAGRGDEQYQARAFVEARGHYEDSLAQLQAVQAAIPVIVQTALDSAAAALEEGDRKQLDKALERLRQIEPDNGALAQLEQRAASLEPLMALLANAADAETDGDLAAAERQLREATELDKAHKRARAELERVAAAHREQRYSQAMSEGYGALDNSRFGTAQKAFEQAAKLRPNSPEVAAAVAELRSAKTAAQLADLQRQGRELEDSESWQEAAERYAQALKIDATLVFAQEGLARATPRARLAEQLSKTLAEPERLADTAVAANMEALLQQASRLQPQGPILAEQLAKLERLLRQANTPVAVTVRSDQLTEVTIQRVARLGRIREQTLSLRPGTYTAVGSRDGYRDVRQNFTIQHDQTAAGLFIACTDPI
ncbi:hypothetical protein CWI75_13985 [Kineobactrum sediminis]|uniref:Tetratricopeptide repeat protein n=2 Tax=Kineobactrum sediminis TaxID=1905677 RepID=A0A2N5Y0D4_9GAMM|nr:hypothetical protein CWI75_13985 [Kineobactrum sediminis]